MTDLISRQAAIKIAERYGLSNGSALGPHSGTADLIAEALSHLPTTEVFVAHRRYEGESKLIIADSIEAAKAKAVEVFGLSSVVVCPIGSTDDPQVYEL